MIGIFRRLDIEGDRLRCTSRKVDAKDDESDSKSCLPERLEAFVQALFAQKGFVRQRIVLIMQTRHGPIARKGRGALSNAAGRFERFTREDFDDGWSETSPSDDPNDDPGEDESEPSRLRTTLTPDTSRTVISWNRSPDLPFDRSINPYRGCEHGCIYCYARPSHAWLGLSPGIDFESRLVFKPDAASKLREELAKPGYRCAPIALGTNTDPYQPVERELGITRSILEVLAECGHPLTIVTKSSGVERDRDLLAEMAKAGRCMVALSITTLDRSLARRMEPRASSPHRRMETVRHLSAAGIPVGVFAAPMIPFINDAELEEILEQGRAAGAIGASYTMLRLPMEIADLFREWLAEHYPDRAHRVMERVRDTRGGKDYDSTFFDRMRGGGPVADLLARRFKLAVKRLGFPGFPALDRSGFVPPCPLDDQLSLF